MRVSVVIPTFDRPELVLRAVRSALAQTVTDIEVIVVVDGPDDATVSALARVHDDRLRTIVRPESGGAPAARNAGIAAARAPWTALLDDDDEWLPAKLAVQLMLAGRARASRPVIACRLLNRTPRAEFVMPRRLPANGEPISEYLSVRRGLFYGDGFVQTSTIMAPTSLLREVPFTVGLRRQQELDWTLRATAVRDVEFLMADDALVIWNQDENRPRITTGAEPPWSDQLEWLRRSRPLFTPRAYAAHLMSVIAAMAAPTHSPRVFGTLLRDARRNGRPGAVDYLTYLQIWLLPPDLRHQVRDRLLRRRGQRAPEPAPAARGTVPTLTDVRP